MYHKKIIDALGDDGHPVLSKIASITDRIVQIRKSIYIYQNCYQLSLSNTAGAEIEKRLAELCREARALRMMQDNPCIQATSLSIELVLRLSWTPPSQSNVNFTSLASDLKEALCELQIRPCAYMDLTSCQFMIGAIAAGEGSHLRGWYVSRLKRVVQAMRMRGWAEPPPLFDGGLVSDTILMEELKSLWKEIMS